MNNFRALTESFQEKENILRQKEGELSDFKQRNAELENNLNNERSK